jgi:predicted Ser/Thr protein kinase
VIGTTVSHYRVLSQLGSGGMGVVYLAEDLRLKRKVALKFLKTSGSAHPEARLLREAQAASTLDHPNVATIYEIGDWNGQPFIAMAYVPGETLQARLRRGPMALREIVEIAGQMAAGLDAAHAMGVVHRDLKPANVVIGPSGQLKILDFGLAKFDSPDHETMTRVPDEGTTVGTLAYMSPQQAKGLDVDHRADIWALGAVIYEMLAGRPPYEERSVGALVLALASTTPAPVRSFRADTPPELERVLARALERDSSKRTIAVGEIRDELQAISAGLASTGAVADSRRQRRWGRAAFWLLVILAVAAAAAYVPVTGWLNRRWAMRTALPEARRLAGEERYIEALALARDAERHVPGNPDLGAVLAQVTRPITIETNPPGAIVSYAAYGGVPAWRDTTIFSVAPGMSRRTCLPGPTHGRPGIDSPTSASAAFSTTPTTPLLRRSGA